MSVWKDKSFPFEGEHQHVCLLSPGPCGKSHLHLHIIAHDNQKLMEEITQLQCVADEEREGENSLADAQAGLNWTHLVKMQGWCDNGNIHGDGVNI